MSQRARGWCSQTDLGLNIDAAPCYDLGKVTSLRPSGLPCEERIMREKMTMEARASKGFVVE